MICHWHAYEYLSLSFLLIRARQRLLWISWNYNRISPCARLRRAFSFAVNLFNGVLYNKFFCVFVSRFWFECKRYTELVMQFSRIRRGNTLSLWKMSEKCESKQSSAWQVCRLTSGFLLYSNLIKSFDHDIVGFEFNSNELHVHHIKHTHASVWN